MLTPQEWTTLTALLVILAVLLWMIPSCGDPECAKAHARHSVAQRAADIERTHATYHDPSRPQPLCSLCQARKRDDGS
jgi:hypothetical protein